MVRLSRYVEYLETSVSDILVQDISYLNRDLSKVIAIDTVGEHYSSQPENAVILPKWKGNSEDTGLIGLIPFLECRLRQYPCLPPLSDHIFSYRDLESA